MHLNDGGGGGRGDDNNGSETGGSNVLLRQGMWRVEPETGQVSLTEQALSSIINTDPLEKWYILDPEPIASGQFAVVYHCKHRSTGEEFAAKFASRRRLGVDASATIVHEIAVNAILASCARNIKLKDVFTTDQSFILIMEYASGGDLQTLVDENVVFYERHVVSFLQQLLEGLVFIHDRSLVHLDIKPQNLVLMGEFPDCALKLCDFEISRLLTPGHEVREIRGTPDYVAPEILHYEPITTKTDMWSLGVLTYVLLTGFLPFGGDSDQETFMQISWGELDFPHELFDDITPTAIDFIKKLLVREPEKRMSARECLSHPWIRHEAFADSSSTKNTYSQACEVIQPRPQPVYRTESSPPVVSTASTSCSTTTTTAETNAVSENSDATVADTANEQDAQAAQVTGRPPLHPRSSLKSIISSDGSNNSANSASGVPPLPATTPFLNKESRMGSRQNLNRLRSMSKSREVLSERIQMSNLKKNLSKSRERLFDARLGLSTSRDDLLNCKSLSQSVEALTALSQLHQNGALYKSCNNIFIPMIHIVNKDANMPDRMYQSLASINSIPGNDISKKMGYFESRFNSADDYNDLITRRNTNLNMVIGESPSSPTMRFIGGESPRFGLKSNTCRGGRGAEGCDRICSRHNHKQPEPQSTQKIRKLSRSERMKKDAQRRRKERKEREQQEKERLRKFSLGDASLSKPCEKTSNDGSSSPTFRRGSVCHVEQRLQERHERLMEKQERIARKANATGSRRLSSVDSDKSPLTERRQSAAKSNSLTIPGDRSRSNTPIRLRRKSKNESPKGSDVSQASSMESVNGSLESVRSDHPKLTRTRKVSKPVSVGSKVSSLAKSNDVNDNVISNTDNNQSKKESNVTRDYRDHDEAYVSLEEVSKNIDDISANSEDHSSDRLNSNSNNIDQQETNICKTSSVESMEQDKVKEENSSDTHNEGLKCSVLSELPTLHSIAEETDKRSYCRSVSTTSDLGSTISEESEEADQFCASTVDIEKKIAENRSRTRSFSIQHPKASFHVVSPRVRGRSNSVHHQPTTDKARPWGEICSGSVAKALKNFTIQEDSSNSKA